MKTLIPTLIKWEGAGKSLVIARVISTWGSSPRRPGATLAVSSAGDLVGSVSGGCIEGAVREEALEIIRGAPARIIDYGVDDDTAWSVGLSCGGSVRVLIQTLPDFGKELIESIRAGERVTLVTALEDGQEYNLLIRPDHKTLGTWPTDTEHVVAAALNATSPGETDVDELTCFIHPFHAPERLLIVGGADIAVHLISYASSLGFETILMDPRAVFTDSDRFSTLPSRLETAWPQDIIPGLNLDDHTCAVLLTHDPKIDDPAIHLLLRSPVAYIGALGSRRTQEKRRNRLRTAGFSEAEIARIHGPVGIDIGASTPSEIALSIMAEIISTLRKND